MMKNVFQVLLITVSLIITASANTDQTAFLEELRELLKEIRNIHDGRNGRDGIVGSAGGGASFTIWGSSTCPKTPGTELVYSGLAAKSGHYDTGGGIDYQCLSKSPQYLTVKKGKQETRSYITGVEYEDWEGGPFNKFQFLGVPCAVCYTSVRSVTIMIPGQYICPTHFTREYYGYLAAERYNHANPSTHVCVDKGTDGVPGTQANKRSGIMMVVEATCPAHLCPPYKSGEELTCAVCTR